MKPQCFIKSNYSRTSALIPAECVKWRSQRGATVKAKLRDPRRDIAIAARTHKEESRGISVLAAILTSDRVQSFCKVARVIVNNVHVAFEKLISNCDLLVLDELNVV